MSGPQEAIVYGVNAALAVGRYRPESILRVFHEQRRRLEVAPLLKIAAAHHRPYREVTSEELERIAKTVHHEGVVVVTEPLPLYSFETVLKRLTTRSIVIALDSVGNPHNLGAILRSAAWFGVDAVLVPEDPEQAMLSAAAVRIAQGGAETVPCVAVPNMAEALKQLKEQKIAVIAADQNAERSVIEKPLHRPCCIVFGNEQSGISSETRQVCPISVTIPGNGRIESLNVAVSAGIILALVK